jgi:hypothetical protein
MVTSRRRTAAWLSAGILTAACGNSPTTPDGPRPGQQFLTGPATLTVSSDERVCSAKTPGWGASGPRVVTPVTVTAEGSGYTARPDDPRFGTAVMSFGARPTVAADTLIGGQGHGTLIDEQTLLVPPHPNSVALAGAVGTTDALFNGIYRAQLGGASGLIVGSIVFTDRQDGQMTCFEALWSMSPR